MMVAVTVTPKVMTRTVVVIVSSTAFHPSKILLGNVLMPAFRFPISLFFPAFSFLSLHSLSSSPLISSIQSSLSRTHLRSSRWRGARDPTRPRGCFGPHARELSTRVHSHAATVPRVRLVCIGSSERRTSEGSCGGWSEVVEGCKGGKEGRK